MVCRSDRHTPDGGYHRIGRSQTKPKGLRENGLRVRPESRIPLATDVLPVTIEHACANLQQQVGAPMAPAHLLFFHHAPAHHLVHRRFYKPRADPLAVAIAFTIVGDERLIAIDERVEFLYRLAQLADFAIIALP